MENNSVNAQEVIDMLLEEIKTLTQDKVVNKVFVNKLTREAQEKDQLIYDMSVELQALRPRDEEQK